VPAGAQGKVVSFKGNEVVVKFASGEFLFPPSVLYCVGEETHGFKLGDSVAWTSEEFFVADVPRGSVGTLIGMGGDKFIVDFGRRQLLIELADLRLAPGPSK
jgi:hypothetical protein